MHLLALYIELPSACLYYTALSQNMESVVENIMSKTNTHGRLVSQSSGSKVWVYDCPHWSQKTSSYLNFCYPNIVTSVEQCSSSVSGFVIILEEKKHSYALFRVCIAFSFIVFLSLVLYVYYNLDMNASEFLNWKLLVQYIMSLV